jgi:hypothetical protein
MGSFTLSAANLAQRMKMGNYSAKKYKRSKKRLDMVFGQKSKNVLAVSNRFNFDVRVAQATGSKLLGYKRHALP